MAYIYLITNIVNKKPYIGKTERSVNSRFAEHKRDCSRRSHEARPLYRAMNKYGVDNFTCETILETYSPEKDEVRLIKEHDTYSKGYNATLGGDGSRYLKIDIEELKTKYLESSENSIKALAEKYGHDSRTISKLLKSTGIKVIHGSRNLHIPVQKIDKDTGAVLEIFKSVSDAGRSIGHVNGSHITKCCKGKRKTVGGYIWKYVKQLKPTTEANLKKGI